MSAILLIALFLFIRPVSDVGSRDEGFTVPAGRALEINSTLKIFHMPKGAKELRLWLPLPSTDPYQEIMDVEIDSPYPYTVNREEKYGNRMAFFAIPDPPKSIEITLRYKGKRLENINGNLGPTTTKRMEWALQPSRLIPLSPVVREIALANVDPSDIPLNKGRALYDHTASHLNYDKTGDGWGNGDWQYACDSRKGNCTDYHSYFIGLCRNIGIPAYFEIGYAVPGNATEGRIPGYHCWAYFWDGNCWVPVDISEGDKHPEKRDYFFGHHDANRVSLSRGRDIVLEPPQKEEPLNYFVYPYAELDGKKYNEIDWNTTFQELSNL